MGGERVGQRGVRMRYKGVRERERVRERESGGQRVGQRGVRMRYKGVRERE